MGEMSFVHSVFVNTFKEYGNAWTFRALRRAFGIAPDAICLEIGCGKGDMARRIVDYLKPRRYVATDYDPQQLERARAKLSRAYNGTFPESLELKVADALALPFPDASFDTVFGFAVLHHVEDEWWLFQKIPKALEEVRRVLRPGGRFVYEEYVNRKRIRDFLGHFGFRLNHQKIFFGIAEVAIATKGPAAIVSPSG